VCCAHLIAERYSNMLFMSFLICVNGDSVVSTDWCNDHSVPLNDISRKENHTLKLYDSREKNNILLHETTNSTGTGRILFLSVMMSKTDSLQHWKMVGSQQQSQSVQKDLTVSKYLVLSVTDSSL